MADKGHDRTIDLTRCSVKTDVHAEPTPATELTLASTIVDIARTMTRSMPPPRGAPYFYLDTDAPYDLRLLDALIERGIFRKYECALDLGCALGGRARWMAARSWCRVVGIDPRPALVAAAVLLNDRARMGDQVNFVPGRLDRLPLRERTFTHVWCVDPSPEVSVDAVLAEAYRVLRRGAHFGLQFPMPSRAAHDVLLATLRHVGFIDLEETEVAFVEVPHASRVPRERLALTWSEQGDPASAGSQLTLRPERGARLQVFARRPA